MSKITEHIRPEMTVLDIVSQHRETEAVFKRYDEKAGECICCQALFDTVQDVAEKYGLDLGQLITELKTAIKGNQKPAHGH
jgi:hypothetical protein